jgi:retron-type reverse transcriptase
MGIQVNLVRALERITLRIKQKKVVYGLFIDFSNAYNSIPHELLFKKLRDKKVLEEEEITFIEQLYARYKTQIGSKTLKSNKGVAQGSVISPALFNIFIEDLSMELKTKANLDLEDLLYYADDLMTLCTSIEQVKTAIKIIEEWSERNGMSLNKKKSGIVVFAKRRANKIPMMKTLKEKIKNNKTLQTK